MSEARWAVAEPPALLVAALEAQLHCPPAIASLLAVRGVAEPEAFFNPTLDDLHAPSLMRGMSAAVARIQAAVAAGEPILIYGDYDVDGTTATVLLKTAIERIAPVERPARVTYHVPHRLREGYGIQNVRLSEAAGDGIRLVISVDTGIRAFAAATEAAALGLDLIVTDHHLPDTGEGLPRAVAVLNPNQPGCPYPNKNLCGAGVAFKLAHALLKAHATTPVQQQRLGEVLLPSFLKLVALATIADAVALTGENRVIAALGLRALANPVQPGLCALMQVAQLALDRPPTAMEVAFRLAPRINAAGRMDVASDVVELFLTRDAERATELAAKLDRLNTDRRAIEAAALDAIELQLQTLCDPISGYGAECIILDHPEWHRGVLGILASRVVERTGRPALILTADADAAHGSGRSIAGFHLLDALTAVDGTYGDEQPLFSRFGGHAHAVGFSLPPHRLPHLRDRMRLHSASLLAARPDQPDLLTPTLLSDAELVPAEITAELFQWVERCEPFGHGHPQPVFLIRGLVLAGAPRIIKERHLCLPLTSSIAGRSLSAMGWSRSGKMSWRERAEALKLAAGCCIDIVCTLKDNQHPNFGGLELELLDLRLSITGAALV